MSLRQSDIIVGVKLEDLQATAAVRGILSDALITVVSARWFGSDALELTYRGAGGELGSEILYRDDEARLEMVEQGRPWSFDGDGELFRLVSEALRIHLAHLFDPTLAVHTSLVEPLPHQITAACGSMRGVRWLDAGIIHDRPSVAPLHRDLGPQFRGDRRSDPARGGGGDPTPGGRAVAPVRPAPPLRGAPSRGIRPAQSRLADFRPPAARARPGAALADLTRRFYRDDGEPPTSEALPPEPPESPQPPVEERSGIWSCATCGNEYDPAYGDPLGEVAPHTAFAALPAGWRCPVCDSPPADYQPCRAP